jgi:hypothetical protein
MPQDWLSKYEVAGPTDESWLDKYDAADVTAGGNESWLDKYDPPPTGKAGGLLGKVADPLFNAGTTAVSKIFNLLDTPQNALQGAAAEAISPTGKGLVEGFKSGLSRETDYSTKDVLNAAGWKDDSWTRAGVGLAGDLILDPLNLVGVGALKSGYQGLVRGGGAALRKGVQATPVANKILKGAEAFIDPHAALKDGTPGLKDAARLAESKARSIASQVDHEVANTFATKRFGGGLLPEFISTPDKAVRQKIAYAIDEDKVATLAPEEQKLAAAFTKKLDEQWDSELATQHQGPTVLRGKVVPGSPKLPNYVPYTTKPDAPKNISAVSNLKGTTRFSQKRDLGSLKESVEHGGSDDAVELLRTRLLSGRKAQDSAATLENFASQFGSMTPKPGFRKLNIPENISMPKGRAAALKDVHVPEDVAGYMERYHTITTKPDEVEGAIKNAVKVYKGWLVTTPQQIITNAVGNVVNAFVSGHGKIMRPDKMIESFKSVMDYAPVPDIKGLKGPEILKAMEQYEIVNAAGQYHDIIAKGKNFSANPLNAGNAAGRTSQHLNQHLVEEPFKVSLFLDQLRQGKSLEEAAIVTKNTFFDYAEVSESAKKIRDYGVAPFITWQLKNIPFQIKNLAENPQKFAQMESVYSGVKDVTGGDEAIVPHKDEREGLVPIGPDKLARFANPINDLNRIPLPGLTTGDDFLTDTLGGMVPWLKAPLELANSTGRAGETGKQFYSGQPIARQGSDGTVPMNTLTQLAQVLGVEGLLTHEGMDGYPKQNEYLNYALQQMPWQYYGRNFLPTPEELVDSGKLGAPSVGDIAAGTVGFRTKDITHKAKLKELERRINQMQP